MTLRDIERVLYLKHCSNRSRYDFFRKGQLLSDEAYLDAVEQLVMNLLLAWALKLLKLC